MEQRPLTSVEREALFTDMRAWTERSDLAFTLDGPLMCAVLIPDNTYRTYSLAKQDFFWTGYRIGVDSREILIFKPLERDERFTQMEVKLKDADKFFPLLADALRDFMIGRYPVIQEDMDLMMPVIQAADTALETVKLIYGLEAEILNQKSITEQEAMSNLPQFGMF